MIKNYMTMENDYDYDDDKTLYIVDGYGMSDVDEVMEYIEDDLYRYSGWEDDEIQDALDEIEDELQYMFPDEPIILYGFTIEYIGGYGC